MRVILSKFPVNLKNQNNRRRASLNFVKKKIKQYSFREGIIFMNARMYSDIRMWERDQLDLVVLKEKLEQGILAKVFDDNFEIRVTRSVEGAVFGIIR